MRFHAACLSALTVFPCNVHLLILLPPPLLQRSCWLNHFCLRRPLRSCAPLGVRDCSQWPPWRVPKLDLMLATTNCAIAYRRFNLSAECLAPGHFIPPTPILPVDVMHFYSCARWALACSPGACTHCKKLKVSDTASHSFRVPLSHKMSRQSFELHVPAIPLPPPPSRQSR